jgi:hypothetical protein
MLQFFSFLKKGASFWSLLVSPRLDGELSISYIIVIVSSQILELYS